MARAEALDTPVALLLFNRPDTTARVLEAVRRARPKFLFVVADGPRPGRGEDIANCAAARAQVEQIDWPCEVATHFSDVNLGCRRRVSSGLDWVFGEVEEAIILKDDCVPEPSFFRYCTDLLQHYRNVPEVLMISGSSPQPDGACGDASYYSSRYPLIWGWASWRRAWRLYDPDMRGWPEARDSHWLEGVFSGRAPIQYWRHVFQRAYEGLDTWDYALVFTGWIHRGLAIHPNRNLVKNIGFGPNATHTKNPGSYFAGMPTRPLEFPITHPERIEPDLRADDYIESAVFSGTLTRTFETARAHIRARRAKG